MMLSAIFYQDRMHIYIKTGRFPLNYRAWIAKFFRGSAPDPIFPCFHVDWQLIPSPPAQKYAPASLYKSSLLLLDKVQSNAIRLINNSNLTKSLQCLSLIIVWLQIFTFFIVFCMDIANWKSRILFIIH